MADDIFAVENHVDLLNLLLLTFDDVDIVLRHVVALHSEESQRLERAEVLLILKDLPKIRSMMLEELRHEQEVAVLVSVVDLVLELGLHVDLGVQVNHVVEQLAPIPALAHFVTASDDEDLRVGHIGVDVLVEFVEVADVCLFQVFVRLFCISL